MKPRITAMTLPSGIYKIRNYRTRNHATLPRVPGDIVACDGCSGAGEEVSSSVNEIQIVSNDICIFYEQWQVEWKNDNNKYHIKSHEKPDYYATGEDRLTLNADTYLRGLAVPLPQLWEINPDHHGRRIDDTTETFTCVFVFFRCGAVQLN